MSINAGTVHSELVLDTSKYEAGITAAQKQMNAFAGDLQKTGKKMEKIGGDMTKKLTLPIVGMGAAALKANIDYESAFAGVRKTVEATEPEFAKLSAGIREMSKEIPASATAIAEVAEAAGQLGIQTENILEFSRVMIDLGEATNLSATDAATAFARFANIVGMSQQDFDRLGSVVVDLGNNLATTEAEIVSMAMRLAGAGKQIGLTEAQIMAFAGALSSVGIEAEAGGSAFSRLMVQMQLAVETGSEDLTNFAAVAGTSAQQFQQAFRDDAAGAMIAFIEGLATAEQRGLSAIKVLDDMGITEIRLRDALLRASGASDVFSESLDIGSKAWEENTALANEAAQRYETTASKLSILKNRAVDTGISIGEQLLPHLIRGMEIVEGWIEGFNKLSPGMQGAIIKTAALVAAAGPLLSIGGKITGMVGGGIKLYGKLQTALTATTVATTAGTKATEALAKGAGSVVAPANLLQAGIKGVGSALTWLAANPVVAAVGALALLGAAFVSARNKAKQAMEDMTNAELAKLKDGYEQQKQLAYKATDDKIAAATTGFEQRKALIDREYQAAKEAIEKETEARKEGVQSRLDSLKREHDAVIQQLRDEYGTYKETTKSKMDLAREETDNVISLLEKQKEWARDLHKERIKQLEDQALAALDEETRAQIEALQDQIDGIDELTKAEEKAERERRDQEKAALLQSRIEQEEDAERRAELQRDLQELLADIDRRALLERREEQKADLREQIAQVKANAEEQKRLIKEGLNEELEEKKRVEKEMLDAALDRINDEQEQAQQALSEKLRQLEDERVEKERIETAKYEAAKTGLDRELASLEENIALKQNKLAEEYAAKLEHEERMFKALTARLEDEKKAVNQHYEDLKESAETYERAAKRAREAMELAEETQKAKSAYWYEQGTLPGDIAGNALGTNYWRGGLTWVGEQGPELIELPRGSKVYSNQESERMAARSGGITQHITINSPSPLTPSEIARKTKQASQQLAMEWGY